VGSHLSPEFCDFLIANHLILILRTPNCSQKQQPEDLVTFQRVKNAKAPYGFYKRKQQALIMQLARTGKSGIPYYVLFGDCLKLPWENGLSPANNREALRQAGLYEGGGISARPYWVQLKAEQPARRQLGPEARKRGLELLDAAGQERCAAYDALTPPWVRVGQLTVVDDEGGEAEEEEEGAGGSGRLTSGELSQLGCAATDPPAQKYLLFKLDIGTVKKMSAAELKAELTVIKEEYKGADTAKVCLLKALEATYSATPTCLDDGTPVKIAWRVCKTWLPQNLRAIMYPEVRAEVQAPVQAKKKRALGSGAYACGAQAAPAHPLALMPPALALMPPALAPPPA